MKSPRQEEINKSDENKVLHYLYYGDPIQIRYNETGTMARTYRQDENGKWVSDKDCPHQQDVFEDSDHYPKITFRSREEREENRKTLIERYTWEGNTPADKEFRKIWNNEGTMSDIYHEDGNGDWVPVDGAPTEEDIREMGHHFGDLWKGDADAGVIHLREH